MDFDALESHGVERGVIEAWTSGLGRSLLNVQERAVKAGVLAGRNLIVFAPTSSGKTVVGEMAAVKAAHEGKRVFYLVPLKALAEEKYREFRARYGPLGIEVVISSRDRAEFDLQILEERYRLAITTFEKLDALLTSKPALVESVGLVVVDELQMIADPDRGGTLEILLAKLRRAKEPPQIVGLSAVLERCEPLAAWLGAQLVVEKERPVELRKGVLLDGTFHYVEHNGGRAGTETFFPWTSRGAGGRDDRLELAQFAVRHLAQTLKEPTIVFVPDRRSAVLLARKCSPLLSLPPAEEAVEELRDLEDCEARDVLSELLANGIAFHHADLPLACRELVERHFRKGGIRVLFSTTTLAMGLNLPARNVLIVAQRWRRDRRYGWVSEPISKMEFENLAGRAARLGFGDPFGRAILCETSRFEMEILLDRYVRAPFEPLVPALRTGRLEEAVLTLVTSGLAKSEEEIGAFLRSTFSGDSIGDRGKSALARLSECHLVEGTVPTSLGRALAGRGLGCETGAELAAWVRDRRAPTDLELLLALGATPDAGEFHLPLSKREHRDHRYEALLRERRPDHPFLGGERAMEYGQTLAVKKAAILLDWIDERPVREIEQAYEIWSGSVERLGEEFAWLAEATVEIAACERWDAPAQEGLRRLASRLATGVRAELLPIADARTRRLGRGVLRRLWDAGLRSMEELRASSLDGLQKILPRRSAQAVFDRLHDASRPEEPVLRKPADETRLVLVGEPRSHGRATILADGVERMVSRTHFEILFAFSRKEWLPLAEVGGDIDTARKEILRLRKKLATMLRLTGDQVLQTDGQKRYRLLVPLKAPAALIRKHQPDLATSPR